MDIVYFVSGIIPVCPHIWASVSISVPSQRTVHLKMLHVESHLSCVFFFNVFYGQAFINLFYSSSPLFQFPGKKPLVGRNVRAISVSVPFFPCVNALPSKSTASLCIYCVRRWVLSFFPFFMDEICPLFWELRVIWWWIVGAPRVRDWMSERAERERENLNASVRWRKATWLWEERVWTKAARVFSVRPSEGHSFTFFCPSCSVYLPPFLILQSYLKSCI